MTKNQTKSIKKPEHEEKSPIIFDRKALYHRLMDDEEIVQAIIPQFLDDMPKQINTLRNYVHAGNMKQTEEQAHKIKGAGGNMGSPALQEIAYAMERAGKAGNTEELQTLMPKLENCFSHLKKLMEADLAQYQS
ncbi:MAG: Hpt domain-containing protein [Desulfobulbaceae bacterium]|nr:Hpt domain-containing protein [Desulfobulbaceae bacterium]